MALEVYSPMPVEEQPRLELAPRLGSLAGRTVGFIGNLKPNCDVLLHTTEDLLTSRRGVAETVYREKISCSIGAPEEILDEIAGRCDAAVVALGD
jgi:hypothetical protein